ncbi:MAG: CPBP family intramembrane glutamic endopeptidase [Bacteroidales bacterium]
MLRPDFSHLKPGNLLFILLLLFVGCLIFSSLLSMGVAYLFYGKEALQAVSALNPGDKSFAGVLRLMQALNHMGSFLLTSVLFIAFAERPDDKKRLRGDIPGGKQLWLCILLVFVSAPWIAYVYEWNRHLPFPLFHKMGQFIANYEKNTEKLINALLADKSTSGLLANLFVMAFLPALGEELLFRGILQRHLQRWWGNIHLAILVTAFIFSILHLSFSGFFPRWLLGIILGYLFYFSGNIWLPITAHFINNSIAVLAGFLYHNNLSDTPFEDFGYTSNLWINLVSLGLTVVILSWFALNHNPRREQNLLKP